MKKLILFSLILIGCSKTATTPTIGNFSIDGTTYDVERTYVIPMTIVNYIEAESGTSSNLAEFKFAHKDSAQSYTATKIKSSGVSQLYYDLYISKSGKKITSNRSSMSVTKNSNGTYTAIGSIFLYENYDSSKRVLVTANFTTL